MSRIAVNVQFCHFNERIKWQAEKDKMSNEWVRSPVQSTRNVTDQDPVLLKIFKYHSGLLHNTFSMTVSYMQSVHVQ